LGEAIIFGKIIQYIIVGRKMELVLNPSCFVFFGPS